MKTEFASAVHFARFRNALFDLSCFCLSLRWCMLFSPCVGCERAAKNTCTRCMTIYRMCLHIYIYMTFKSDFACRACSSLMFSVSRLWEAVELLRLGVASNWFGLACPHHCGPATFPSLGLAFILGCICGFSSACFAIYHLLRPCPPVVHLCHPSAGLAIDRLRGYLNERGATT